MLRRVAVGVAMALTLGLGGCAPSTGAGHAGAARRHSAHSAKRQGKSPKQASLVSSGPAPGHVYYKDQVVILMYHGLGPQAHGDIITPAAFAGEMAAMQSAGFRFLSLGQVASFLQGGPVPPNSVCITFDDGLESVYTYAYPILLRNHIPFATFLIAGRVNTFTGDLSWAQVKAMERSGLLTVGSHTLDSHDAVAAAPGATGPALTTRIYSLVTQETETQSHYDARVQGDLSRSRKILQIETGQPVRWFAYPFGSYDPAVEQMLLKAGYSFAVTTWGWGTSAYARPLTLPRENAGTPKVKPSTIVPMVLYVTHLTANAPRALPPQQYVPVWR